VGKWAKPVEVEEARRLLDGGAVLIDVRNPEEFAREHLDAAVNLPLDDIEQHMTMLGASPVLLYCSSGTRSQVAFHRLREKGLEAVFDLGSLSRARHIADRP